MKSFGCGLVLAIFVIVALSACRGVSNKQRAQSPSPSSSNLAPGSLQVTVRAGGDCRQFTDRFEIRGREPGHRGTVLLGLAGKPTLLPSDPPGLIPCQFRFEVPRLPPVPKYIVVDRTRDLGWGPWTLEELDLKHWQVTVAITDLK